jgi:DNA-binding FadR family transcriptional regulator
MPGPRTGELVAEEIRQRILSGELGQGDEIPPEADLLARFGVSRPTLRDGLRILETEGLIRIRRGRFGGAIVLQPTAERAAYQLSLVLRHQGTTMEDLARARSVIEPVCAGLCAARPDHEDVARDLGVLAERCARLVDGADDPDRFPAAAIRFHTAVLDACGIETLRLLIETLQSMWAETERLLLDTIHEIMGYPTRVERLRIVKAFRLVVTHIAAGDAAGAELVMREHARRSLANWTGVHGSAPARA